MNTNRKNFEDINFEDTSDSSYDSNHDNESYSDSDDQDSFKEQIKNDTKKMDPIEAIREECKALLKRKRANGSRRILSDVQFNTTVSQSFFATLSRDHGRKSVLKNKDDEPSYDRVRPNVEAYFHNLFYEQSVFKTDSNKKAIKPPKKAAIKTADVIRVENWLNNVSNLTHSDFIIGIPFVIEYIDSMFMTSIDMFFALKQKGMIDVGSKQTEESREFGAFLCDILEKNDSNDLYNRCVKYSKPEKSKSGKASTDTISIVSFDSLSSKERMSLFDGFPFIKNLDKIRKYYRAIQTAKIPEIKQKTDYVPQKWQENMIALQESGMSLIVSTPPGSGKTVTAFQIINKLIYEQSDKKLIYICPSFYLSYQKYCDILATFSENSSAVRPSIITSKIVNVVKDTNIVLGTIDEVYHWIQTERFYYDIGIFDEIHNIHVREIPSMIPGQSPIDSFEGHLSSTKQWNARIHNNSAALIPEALKYCKGQLIALSATLSPGELHSLKNKLCEYARIPQDKMVVITDTIKEISKTPMNYYHIHRDSNVIQKIRGSLESSNISPESSKVDFSNDRLVHMLVYMKAMNMFPHIMFFKNHFQCIRSYNEFIEYLKGLDSQEYFYYKKAAIDINAIIDTFNKDLDTALHKIENESNDEKGEDKVHKKLINDKQEVYKNIETILKKNIYSTIKANRTSAFSKYLSEDNRALIADTVPKIVESMNRTTRESLGGLSNDVEMEAEFSPVVFSESQYSHELYDLSFLYESIKIKDLSGEHETSRCLPISFYIPEIGSMLSFSKKDIHSQFENILNPKNEEHWRKWKKIAKVAECESIPEAQTKQIIRNLIEGLRFGIGCLPDTDFPFCIIEQLFHMVLTRDLPIIFSSSQMSMGTDFSFMSVTIVGDSTMDDYTTEDLIQMIGRCNRRNVFKSSGGGNIIFWNIRNIHQISDVFLKKLSFPNIMNQFVTDYFGMSINMDVIRKNNLVDDDGEPVENKVLSALVSDYLGKIVGFDGAVLGLMDDSFVAYPKQIQDTNKRAYVKLYLGIVKKILQIIHIINYRCVYAELLDFVENMYKIIKTICLS